MLHEPLKGCAVSPHANTCITCGNNFISLSLLFNLLKDLTLYDINEENHRKNTKQPLDLSYICFASNSI